MKSFTPELLRNGMIILCILTLCNMCEGWTILHRMSQQRAADATRHAHIEQEMKASNAVVQKLCDAVHASCPVVLPADM